MNIPRANIKQTHHYTQNLNYNQTTNAEKKDNEELFKNNNYTNFLFPDANSYDSEEAAKAKENHINFFI